MSFQERSTTSHIRIAAASQRLEQAVTQAVATADSGDRVRECFDAVRRELTKTGRIINSWMDSQKFTCDRVRCAPPPSAAGLLLYRPDTGKVLVTWAPSYRKIMLSLGITEPPIEIHLPGGKLEGDEMPIDAAIREFNEECADVLGDENFWRKFSEEPHPTIEIPRSAYTLFVEDATLLFPSLDLDSIPERFLRKRKERAAGLSNPLKYDVAHSLEWVDVPDQRSPQLSEFARTVFAQSGLRRYLNSRCRCSKMKKEFTTIQRKPATEQVEMSAETKVEEKKEEVPASVGTASVAIEALLKTLRSHESILMAKENDRTITIIGLTGKHLGMVPPSIRCLQTTAWNAAAPHVKGVKISGFLIDSLSHVEWFVETKIPLDMHHCHEWDELSNNLRKLESTSGGLLTVSVPGPIFQIRSFS